MKTVKWLCPLSNLSVATTALDLRVLRHLEEPIELVDLSLNLLLENQLRKKTADIFFGNIELAWEEINADWFVGFHSRDQNIQSDVSKEVIEVLADEGVIQDLGVLASKDLLDRIYVILLVSWAKVHYRLDLRILVVYFGLSCSGIVDLGSAQNWSQNHIL